MNILVNKLKILALTFIGLVSPLSYASGTGICTPVKGANQFNYNGSYDVAKAADDSSGTVLNDVFHYDLDGRYRMKCDGGAAYPGWIKQDSVLPVYKKEGDVTWYKLNDYLAASFKGWVAGKVGKYFNLPFIESNNQESGADDNEWISGSKGTISLMVIKPFVGFSDINTLAAYTSVAVGSNGKDFAAVAPHASELWMHIHVNVPQSCELDAGTTVTMDFGNIGAPLFSQAGAGNKPVGVNPKAHTISVKCKNIDAQALLSMRLESDNISGNAIVSDNKDVGFIVAGSDKVPLTPNNIDSKIKFQLDENSAAMVPITAWPVSITGNKPAEGRFTAEGYLRVDFD